MDKILSILRALGLPFAYDHFAEGEAPAVPFIVYHQTGINTFLADGTIYSQAAEISVELYTEKKEPQREAALEQRLLAAGILFDKTETWIPSEKLYEILYTMEV